MSKKEYLARLEALLANISPEERQAAMEYYTDYLGDAGPEGERAAMEHLGTPEKVAAAIRKGLEEEGFDGEWTEQGYEEEPPWREVPDKRGKIRRRERSGERSRRNVLGLLILLIVIGFCGVPAFTTVAAVGLSLVMALGALCFGGFAVVLVLVIVGLVMVITGLLKLSLLPGAGATVTGLGFFCLAGAFFLLPLCPWIIRRVIPGILNGISQVFHKIFRRGGRSV